jgi:uncharacterized membrane protein
MKKVLMDLPDYIKTTIALTLVNLLILAIRNLAVGDHFYNFLKSNLFIGSFPTLVIAVMLKKYHTKLNGFFFWFGTCVWILFYPNAPYMISDLIHNGEEPLNSAIKDLIIYDTIIIFSIAMLSIFYGFLSLKIMFAIFKVKYGKWVAHSIIFITVLLSCLGFYIGRKLLSAINLGNGYIYSWEIFLEPVQIIKTVWAALFPISEHLSAFAMMALFGIVQYVLLIMFKDIGNIESNNFITKE